jgi:integrase
MASVERRERKGRNGEVIRTYRVRWWGPNRKQRSKSFKRKVDADRFAATISADIVRGSYIDPDAGRVRFEEYAERWLKAQTFEEGTFVAVESRLRNHAYPVLGQRFVNDIQPSTVQAWLSTLKELAPTYRQIIFANVSSVFTAAVDDSLIAANPCRARSVRRPKLDRRKVTPWSKERVLAVRDELPERYRLVVWLGAGLGLRQGEIFGLSPDDIDLERGEVQVRRQVKLLPANKQIYGLPKGRKTREVPLPNAVLEAINLHMTRWPPVEVALPWDSSTGRPLSVPLLIYSREKKALGRNYFNSFLWKPALVAAGAEPTRTNGCHALRHFFASTALHEGESIKALSEYLGHADPGFTLRTYTHLVDDGSDRTKRAVDAVFDHKTPDHEPTAPDVSDADGVDALS